MENTRESTVQVASPSSVESSPNDSLGERLKGLKEKSKLRRALLAGQLGLTSPDNLGQVLQSRVKEDEVDAVNHRDTSSPFSYEVPLPKRRVLDDNEILDTSKGIAWKAPTMPEEEIEEEEIYTDSSAFLKGTQSANPHNDYCQNFVDTGERPQNFIHDVGLANRFEEYPKLRELIRLKDELIQNTNTPPMYLKCDLETYDLRDLGIKFDSILIEPPLEEYQRTLGVSRDKYWSWEMIEKLEIDKISAHRSFLWIWCGSSDGLDAARRCLRKWGFRRCEDICWVKTNLKNPGHNKNLEPRSIFQRSKEHCLMGIKGTVRRSTDGDFIHANVDIDIIIDDEKEWGSPEKPVEIFHIAEHFCLGRRRLHIFGRDSTIRPGWLTVGPDLTSSNFDSELYSSFISKTPGITTGCTEEIERLRPKSPPPKNKGGAPGATGNARGGAQKGGGAPRGGSNRGGPNRGGPHTRGASSGRGGASSGRGGVPRGGGAPRGGGGPRRGGGENWGGRPGPPGGNYAGGRGRGGHKGGLPQR